MCKYGKLGPVEATPGMERRTMENDGGGEFSYDIL
jgi:hypothetical protein